MDKDQEKPISNYELISDDIDAMYLEEYLLERGWSRLDRERLYGVVGKSLCRAGIALELLEIQQEIDDSRASGAKTSDATEFGRSYIDGSYEPTLPLEWASNN